MSAANVPIADSICGLLDDARRGNNSAKAELLQQLETYLKVVAEKQVDPHLRAKLGPSDLVQQSFAVAVENFDQFRGHSPGELFAWVTTIIQNEINQQRRAFRTEKRDVRREKSVHVDSQLRGRGVDLADRYPTPGTRAENQEQVRALAHALERLPEDYRQVIRMRNWERLPFKDIAERMNQSVSAVTRIWYRALISLQRELEEHVE